MNIVTSIKRYFSLYINIFFVFFIINPIIVNEKISLIEKLNVYILIASFLFFMLSINIRILKRKKRQLNNNVKALYILFFLWSVFSLIWSQGFDISVLKLFSFFYLLLLSMIIAKFFNYYEVMEVVKYSFLLVLILNILSFIVIPDRVFAVGIQGLHYHKNGFAVVFSILALYFYSHLKDNERHYVLLSITLIIILLSGAKMAFISLLLTLIITKFAREKFYYLVTGMWAFVSMLLVISLVISGSELLSYIANLLPGDMLTGRGYIWSFALNNYCDIYFGCGYGSFWNIGEYSSASLDFFYEGSPSHLMWFSKLKSGHNGYLDIFIRLGLIGFILLSIIIALSLVSSVRSRELSKFPICIMLFSIMVNVTDTYYFDSQPHLFFFFILFGILHLERKYE